MQGLEDFRTETIHFINEAKAAGVTCEDYGAILSPALFEPAKRWQRYCFDHGFAGIHWPKAHGGRGLTQAHTVVWNEECARAGVAPFLNLQGLILAGEALLRSGTEEQKERFLRPTLSGEMIWCQLFSEPGAGSDLAGLATKAEADGERFMLNGQKVWSSNAELAHFGILLARTSPDRPAHKGLSFFCYDMSLPGTDVRPLVQMTGDAEFSEVFFSDVSMPADALLGELHEGWRVAMSVLQDERGSFGAAGAIRLGRRLDSLAPLATESGPVGRDRYASLLSSGRALGHLLSASHQDPTKAPIAKVMRSELDGRAVAAEIDARGAEAMINGEVTDSFLYSPGMRIAGGSSEIQRNIIGERILGLPREPRPTKD